MIRQNPCIIDVTLALKNLLFHGIFHLKHIQDADGQTELGSETLPNDI